MGHYLSDFVHKVGVWCGFTFSFIEQNIAVLSFALGFAGYLTRLYYDRKDDARRAELHAAQIKQLPSDS